MSKSQKNIRLSEKAHADLEYLIDLYAEALADRDPLFPVKVTDGVVIEILIREKARAMRDGGKPADLGAAF